jgi:hypothetical protein
VNEAAMQTTIFGAEFLGIRHCTPGTRFSAELAPLWLSEMHGQPTEDVQRAHVRFCPGGRVEIDPQISAIEFGLHE